jgi:SAM-dependent methyltransferase
MKTALPGERDTGLVDHAGALSPRRRPPPCRACGQDDLQIVLDLGCAPLANSLLEAGQLDQAEPTYPLELAFCPQCALVQLLETVAPEKLFRDYLYCSSFSDTMVEHARALAEQLSAERRLSAASLVMEAASNDGYLLRHYRARGIPVLGIEPARQAAGLARTVHGIETVEEFFDAALAERLRSAGRRADVFHAHNVLAHVANLNGFVAGIRTVLKDDGIALIEVPYVKNLVDQVEFDTIYHEHLCYFSLTALNRLLRRHDLAVRDAQRLAIHGGSLRLVVTPAAARPAQSARFEALLREEQAWGVDRPEYYLALAQRVQTLRTELRSLLADLKQQGRRVAAYGASAKGSMLLNYCGIGRDVLDFVVDRSPLKQGRYLPGVHVPIHPPAKLLEARPDYVLLLTWNFLDEILQQQAEYRRGGGRFICPVPTVRVA